MAGDINADFLRNTGHVQAVKHFVSRLCLHSAWTKFEIDFTHTSEINGHTYCSTLDHFFWSENLSDAVIDAGVIHTVNNPSDHSPIFCVIDHVQLKQDTVDKVMSKPKPSWKKASDDQKLYFKSMLQEQLSLVEIPSAVLSCSDVKCENFDHKTVIDNYVEDVLNAINISACESLPIPVQTRANLSKSSNRLAGWSSEVKPFKDQSMFWAAVWKSAGRPLNNELHNTMKKWRNIYHYQVKKISKAQDEIKKSKLLSCLSSDDSCENDIFKEIKKLRSCPTAVPSVIDGKSFKIENHFSDIYRNLYNSVDDHNQVQMRCQTIRL